VLHAAWLCKDHSVLFQGVFAFIHSFRMPGFFLIAGFFSARTLARFSPEEFLVKRLRRLAIPLVVFTLLDTLINCANHSTWGDYSIELSGSYWATGEWLEHLWFLGTLIFYVLILAGVRKLWGSMDSQMRRVRLDLIWLLALVSIGSYISLHIERSLPGTPWRRVWFVADQIKVFQYWTFFAFGYLLFHNRELLTQLSKRTIFNGTSAVLYWALGPLILRLPPGSFIMQLWQGLYILNMCGLLFWCAQRFFGRENRVVRSLSEASYTMYLVHWPIIVILNRILNHDQMPISLVFGLFIVLTAVLSYSFHVYLVRKSDLLMFLMNGRSMTASFTPVTARTTQPVTSG
jgi:peptidoglycan/LPS O-acetylase OafA/YrhL